MNELMQLCCVCIVGVVESSSKKLPACASRLQTLNINEPAVTNAGTLILCVCSSCQNCSDIQ